MRATAATFQTLNVLERKIDAKRLRTVNFARNNAVQRHKRRLRPIKFECSHVSDGVTPVTALIARSRERVVASVDRRAGIKKTHCLRRSTIVGKRIKLRIKRRSRCSDEIAVHSITEANAIPDLADQ